MLIFVETFLSRKKTVGKYFIVVEKAKEPLLCPKKEISFTGYVDDLCSATDEKML